MSELAAPDPQLEAEAKGFAERLSRTVSGFLGRACPFSADLILRSGHFSVEDEDASGIPLTVNGVAVLSLAISYECSWDSSGEFLAVHESRIAVHAGPRPGKHTLFRYEYVRGQGRNLPSAHLHVHAHRDAFAHVMSSAGRNASDAKARMQQRLGDVPELSAFHFPLGGHRFRPCLEDVLAVLKEELAVDAATDWRQVLDEGRSLWRRQQVAAVVRDCPDEAIRALHDLNYEVVWRGDGQPPTENRGRMTSL